MRSASVTVKNPTGLHARPGNDFVSFVKTLKCSVEIENEEGKRVKATSLLKVLSLGVKLDSVITIYCDGEGEDIALEDVVNFIDNLKE